MKIHERGHGHFIDSLSGNDALCILEIIHGSLSCHSETQYRNLFSKLQSLFPYHSAIAVLGYQDKRHGFVWAGHANISFPEGWLSEYVSKNYIQADSIVLQNFNTYDVQTWSVARKTRYRKKEITELGMDFGLRECLTHGWRSSPGKMGSMFCFAGPSMELDTHSSIILELIVPHLHVALSRIGGKSRIGPENGNLSAREKEVLNWLKQGKSSWDMSIILGISERTVNFHVYNMMRKLGVTSRLQAVAVAAESGFIDMG
ncbi:MAG: LuxR C-terminal-related transcriptional regulator [Geobacteraceae bacterium]|nr:LuxR C-terminal-related transcriptional regulator [Geobacteraceae bacterium]